MYETYIHIYLHRTLEYKSSMFKERTGLLNKNTTALWTVPVTKAVYVIPEIIGVDRSSCVLNTRQRDLFKGILTTRCFHAFIDYRLLISAGQLIHSMYYFQSYFRRQKINTEMFVDLWCKVTLKK